MKSIGVYLIIAVLASVILKMFGYQLSLLDWVETWGEANAWYIRGAVILLGALLWASSDWLLNDCELSQSLEQKQVEDQAQNCF